MKVVLLAGGLGTRISEESIWKPKPMIEIGGKPILWHIMKLYSHYGFNEFVICAGYKQHVIKEYCADYFLHTSDITYDFTNGKNEMIVHHNTAEPWKVTVVDTGLNTMTGGRVKRIREYIGDEPFMLTYGDGVCDVDISKLVEFHKNHGKLATLTAVIQSQDKGVLDISDSGSVKSFREKKANDGAAINAGYMVLQPEVFDYLEDGDATVFEKKPLERLVNEGELMSYRHTGFWQCMDTVREKEMLEKLWSSGNAPWKVWYMMLDLNFYKGKHVFVTGHTGFKGTWLCRMLVGAGAVVTGYSLEAPTKPNLFSLAGLEGKMTSIIGDIRDMAALKAAFDAAKPEIVLHLAAQPIVRDSYKDPVYTYETNVMGTVNILECVRLAMLRGEAPKSVLNVTTYSGSY